MTAPDLIPCPYCGSKARFKESEFLAEAYTVQCVKNGHSDGLLYTDEDAAIAAWNTRAPLDGAVKAIRELQHRWYLGDLTESDFDAALRGIGGQHDRP